MKTAVGIAALAVAAVTAVTAALFAWAVVSYADDQEFAA